MGYQMKKDKQGEVGRGLQLIKSQNIVPCTEHYWGGR
jgi:hypothetical protein